MTAALWAMVEFPEIRSDDGTIPLHTYLLIFATITIAAAWSVICRQRCESGKGILF